MQKIGLSQIKVIEETVQGSDEYVSLSQGALKVGGISPEIKKYVQEILQTDKTDYYQSAWGIMPLREAIATHLSKKYNTCITKNNVLVTHGCMGAISTLMLTLLEPGDEVLVPEPTYPAYKNAIVMASGSCVFVPSMTSDGTWALDFGRLEAARTTKTKMIVFSNPSNPSGAVVPQEALEALIVWCEKNKIYLVVDEAYDEYVFSGDFQSIVPYVTNSDYMIGTGSYSKSLSMSGWRVGYMLVSDRLSNAMGVMQDTMLNCPSVIGQHAVLFALENPKFLQLFHETVKEGRDRSVRLLQPLIARNIFSFCVPRAGFFLFLKTQEPDAFDLCMGILREAKVGLIPGRAFGPSGAPYVRLCYARPGSVLEEGIERIRKFFHV
ncbi:pyridoxal phosphate-dependent aminotransferase [Candidatus Dependentiae bacterium]|nr:pyridoxal phosphate-dependent aminotransferase [Candidatus Dependentiae bacterium]